MKKDISKQLAKMTSNICEQENCETCSKKDSCRANNTITKITNLKNSNHIGKQK